jgi:hypothetical protein
MTDEQIFENEIKCIIRRNEGVCNGGSDCIKCDLLMDSEEIIKCYNRAIKNIKLNNRQKAENERLTAKILVKDNINDYNTAQLRIAREALRTAKSNAIKEFAERVKKYSFVDNLSLDGKETVYVDDIDNLVKEITEEKDES